MNGLQRLSSSKQIVVLKPLLSAHEVNRCLDHKNPCQLAAKAKAQISELQKQLGDAKKVSSGLVPLLFPHRSMNFTILNGL